MTQVRHILIAPRWAGTPQHDWYPWLTQALRASHPRVQVAALDLPSPTAPDPAVWASALAAALDAQGEALPHTLLVGHSVGCQGWLRALAAPGEGPAAPVAGAVMVAGWWTIDRPWDTLRPWLTPPSPDALARARARTPWLDVLLSDDDPFTSDALANRDQWQRDLSASVTILPGHKHFNRPQEPAVLDAILRRL